MSMLQTTAAFSSNPTDLTGLSQSEMWEVIVLGGSVGESSRISLVDFVTAVADGYGDVSGSGYRYDIRRIP